MLQPDSSAAPGQQTMDASSKRDMCSKLSGEWEVDLCSTPTTPASMPYFWASFCCWGCCVPQILTCKQRREILELTGEPYVCCAGRGPGFCGINTPVDRESADPQIVMESVCCFFCAVDANRWYVQSRFGRMNTEMDNNILWCEEQLVIFAALLRCANCLDNMIGFDCINDDCVDAVSLLSRLVTATVFSCMIAQQELAVQNTRTSGYNGPAIPEACPNQQSMNLTAPGARSVVGMPRA
jgi:hypothetical protein